MTDRPFPASPPPVLAVVPKLPPAAIAKRPAFRFTPGVLVAGALLGGLVGYLGKKFGTEALLPGPRWTILVSLGALPLVWLLVVAFHEFGHLVGGWLGGGRLLLYVVGPLKWQRSPAGLVFGWNRNVNVAGGLAACLPLKPALVTPRRLALMIAGGPIFSLALTAALLGASLGLARASEPGIATVIAQHLAMFAAALSLLIFVVTAVPSTMSGYKSDGRRFGELLRGDARSEQEKALIALTSLGLAGIRPAEHDPALIAQATTLRDGSLFDRYGHLTAYAHAADNGAFARAQELLDYALLGADQLAPAVRSGAFSEYAWLLATQTTDAAAARAWLDAAGKIELEPGTRLRAEAAVLLAEGRRPEAAARAREGLHALHHRSVSPTINLFHADTLADLQRRAEA